MPLGGGGGAARCTMAAALPCQPLERPDRGTEGGPSRQSFFFFQAEDGIRYATVTGVQTCALPISSLIPFRSVKSIPAQKAFPPAPVITATRTSSSRSIASIISLSLEHKAPFKLFIAPGRFNVITPTCPCLENCTTSLSSGVLSANFPPYLFFQTGFLCSKKAA